MKYFKYIFLMLIFLCALPFMIFWILNALGKQQAQEMLNLLGVIAEGIPEEIKKEDI